MKKTTSMKRWLRPGRLIPLSLVLLIGGYTVRKLWFTPPPPPAVATAPVTVADLDDTVLATGTIGAFKQVSVGAQVTGEVKKLHVALGDAVHQGQLIAEIDALPQQNSLRNSQAALQSAQAQLRAKQAALKQAELVAARLRELVTADAGARADLDAAEATLTTSQADVAAQQAQIVQAQVAVDTAQVNLSYTRVTAPMDGVVVAVVTEQGQTVNANQSAPTIIKLARLDLMTVKALVSEADVPRVKPGQTVYFNLLGEPDRRYEVKLRAVEPGPTTIATDSTTTTSTSTTSAVYYNGIFDVPNPESRLRINMTAQASILLARVEKALTLPSAALGAREGVDRYHVRVLQGGQLGDRTVRIGLNNRVRAQVLDGLREGELVVTSEASAASTKPNNQRGGPPPF